MKRALSRISILFLALGLAAPCQAADAVVYSVYNSLNMGNPGETTLRDYYVNVGTSQGVQEGTVLEVVRRLPTYDLLTQKLYRDVNVPIARIRVIHAEQNASIARLEKLAPAEQTPAIAPRAVMVGDFVRLAGRD